MPPPNANEALTLPPGEAVAQFRGECLRLIGVALDTEAHQDQRLALAVSGGPDSMAMLALAAAAFPGNVVAATFDHRLRAESADEAAMVAEACARLGVRHETLVPAEPISGSSLQMRARAARYAGLTAWAAREDICPLLTAHHADDQAETLLMRLNRASGLKGLAAIRPFRFEGGVLILRPLLGWRRSKLRSIAERSGLPFVDDPSNEDTHFDRVRMRALLSDHPELDAAALAASAQYLAEAEEVMSQAATLCWAERWHGSARPFAIDGLARELRRRLVRSAIAATRDDCGITLPAFTDSANVEPLLAALAAGGSAVQGGVLVRWSREGWLFSPAPPRRSL